MNTTVASNTSVTTPAPQTDFSLSAMVGAIVQSTLNAVRSVPLEMRAQVGWEFANKELPATAGVSARVEAEASLNARLAMDRSDLPTEQAKQLRTVVEHLGNALYDGRIDPHVNDAFRSHLHHVASAPGGSVEFNSAFAQLNRAAEVLDRVSLAPRTQLTYDPLFDQPSVQRAGLPLLNVAHIDADLYFKTADGVLHVESVKESVGGLADAVKKSIVLPGESGHESQLGRQMEWQKLGATGESRQLHLYALKPGPKFDNVINSKNLAQLDKLVGADVDSPRFVFGERAYSLNDIKKIDAAIVKVAGEHVQTLREEHLAAGRPAKAFDAKAAFQEFFRTQAASPELVSLHTRQEYGTPLPKLSPLDPAAMQSPKQAALFAGLIEGGIRTTQALADGKLTGTEVQDVGRHTTVAAAAGAVGARAERLAAPVIDRAIGASVQRAATRAAERPAAAAVLSKVSTQSSAALGMGARTLAVRAAGSTGVGAVIGAGFSAYDNREGLARGDSKAVGNVVADTAVAATSVLASVATGAAVGTLIPVPVVGTVVGAAAGLVVGIGVAYGAQISGARDAAARTVSGWVDGVKGWF